MIASLAFLHRELGTFPISEDLVKPELDWVFCTGMENISGGWALKVSLAEFQLVSGLQSRRLQ